MWFPSTFRGRALSVLVAALLGLIAPAAQAHPADAPPKVTSPWDEDDQQLEAIDCSPQQRQQLLELLALSVLARSPFSLEPPPVLPPPRDQPRPAEVPPGGGNPPPTPQQVPEPATLVTGAVGSGLALLAWLRGRRRKQSAE